MILFRSNLKFISIIKKHRYIDGKRRVLIIPVVDLMKKTFVLNEKSINTKNSINKHSREGRFIDKYSDSCKIFHV